MFRKIWNEGVMRGHYTRKFVWTFLWNLSICDMVAKHKNSEFLSHASLIICRGLFRRLRQPRNYIMVPWLCKSYLSFCFPSLNKRISWWTKNMERSFRWSFQSSIKIDLSRPVAVCVSKPPKIFITECVRLVEWTYVHRFRLQVIWLILGMTTSGIWPGCVLWEDAAIRLNALHWYLISIKV